MPTLATTVKLLVNVVEACDGGIFKNDVLNDVIDSVTCRLDLVTNRPRFKFGSLSWLETSDPNPISSSDQEVERV